MNRLLPVVLGPELYWLAVYFGFRWLALRNTPATAAGNAALNWAVWIAAAVLVPLSFSFFALPGQNRWVLFARLAVAAFVGFNACAIVACDHINYPEPGRNSGLMALWIAAAIAAGAAWLVSSGVTLVLFRVAGAK